MMYLLIRLKFARLEFILAFVMWLSLSTLLFAETGAVDSPELESFDPATVKELVVINRLITEQNYLSALNRLEPLLEKYRTIPKLHLVKATILSKLENDLDALEYLTDQMTKQPNNIGLLAARAQFLLTNGYLESARDDFYRVYEQKHRPVDVLSVLADIEKEKGNIVKAIELTKQALDLDPNREQLWFKKAELDLKLAQVNQAKISCYKAIQLAPDAIEYHKLYVEILIYLKQRQELETHIKAIYQKFPTDAWISLRMSSLLVEQRDLKGAEQVLIKAQQANPKEHLLLFQLATIMAGERKWEQSIKYFEEGLKLEPSSNWAMVQIAKVYLQTAKANPAVDYLEKARENEARDPFVYETLARIYNRQNDTFEAERVILDGLEINEKNQALILEYANLLEKRGNNRETTTAYEEALENDPESSFILGKLGNLYRLEQRYDESLKVLEKAISLEPKATSLRAYLIETLDEMERWDQALVEIKALLQIMPDDHWAYAKKALIEFETDKLESAHKSITQAIALSGDAGLLKEIEGRILEGLKKYDLAEKAFEEALKRSPESAYILTRLAYVQVHTDKKQALVTIKKALNADDFDIAAIELYLYLAGRAEKYWGFSKQGAEYQVYQQIIFRQYELADKGLKQLTDKKNPHSAFLAYYLASMRPGKNNDDSTSQMLGSDPKTPWHHYYRGVQSMHDDDLEKARDSFKQGLAMSSDNPWLTVKLAFVFQQLKEYQQAVDLLNRFLMLETEGNYLWAQLRLALNYDLAKNFSESERVYKKILDSNPKDNVALNNLAWMYLNATEEAMHKLDDALKLALKAVEIQPSSANLDTLAEAYYQKKDYNRALKAIEQALDRDRRGLDDFKKTKKKILRALEAQEKAE